MLRLVLFLRFIGLLMSIGRPSDLLWSLSWFYNSYNDGCSERVNQFRLSKLAHKLACCRLKRQEATFVVVVNWREEIF